MVDVVGVDHVGFGTDMLGLTGPSVSPRRYADLPLLANALIDVGFNFDEINKLMGGNYARVFSASVGHFFRLIEAPCVSAHNGSRRHTIPNTTDQETKMLKPVTSTDQASRYSEEEWQTRVDLAAAYRLVALFKWDDLVFTHITARVPGSPRPFPNQSVRHDVRGDHRLEPGQD